MGAATVTAVALERLQQEYRHIADTVKNHTEEDKKEFKSISEQLNTLTVQINTNTILLKWIIGMCTFCFAGVASQIIFTHILK